MAMLFFKPGKIRGLFIALAITAYNVSGAEYRGEPSDLLESVRISMRMAENFLDQIPGHGQDPSGAVAIDKLKHGKSVLFGLRNHVDEDMTWTEKNHGWSAAQYSGEMQKLRTIQHELNRAGFITIKTTRANFSETLKDARLVIRHLEEATANPVAKAGSS